VIALHSVAEAERAPEEVRVAVAANFVPVLAVLAADFEPRTARHVVSIPGSTGSLYAQIRNGAPFDVFLAADTLHPGLLLRERLAVPGTRFTYAEGRLALWSADPNRPGGGLESALAAPDVRHVAIANPRTAPYGRAAAQALRALGLWDRLLPKLVYGENVGQTLRFADSKAAELGFVALSQVLDPSLASRGRHWIVPASLYDRLLQDAVLLLPGATNDGAREFLAALRTPEALAIFERFGYGSPVLERSR
jgi:molybdate transport system substrate-binding protein